jgi:hypothetical protein
MQANVVQSKTMWLILLEAEGKLGRSKKML